MSNKYYDDIAKAAPKDNNWVTQQAEKKYMSYEETLKRNRDLEQRVKVLEEYIQEIKASGH